MKKFLFHFMLFVCTSISGLAQKTFTNSQIDSIIENNSEFVYENPEHYYKLAKKNIRCLFKKQV